jgi:hypothetical protein
VGYERFVQRFGSMTKSTNGMEKSYRSMILVTEQRSKTVQEILRFVNQTCDDLGRQWLLQQHERCYSLWHLTTMLF